MSEANHLSRRRALLGAFGVLAAPRLPAAAAPQAAKGIWATVDDRIAALLKQRALVGAQVAITRKGALVYSQGFGFANLETQTRADSRTVFRFASNTKQFTAATLLLLQEAGVLSIEDRLQKYLPQVPRAADITLHQMLNHVSGLGNYTNTAQPETMYQRARIDYTSSELLDAVLKTTDPMYIGAPGEQFAYSNTAYILLGLVIEKATKKPYSEVVATLFKRAALASTAVDNNADVVPGRASGYTRNENAPSGFINSSYISMSYTGAAGSIRSTCEDYCRWHAALFGGRILKPESLRLMTEPVRLNKGQLPTRVRGKGADANTVPVSYGMGLFAADDPQGRLYSHGGGIQGFMSWVGTYPDKGVTIAYITNTDEPEGTPGKTGAAFDELREAATTAVFTS